MDAAREVVIDGAAAGLSRLQRKKPSRSSLEIGIFQRMRSQATASSRSALAGRLAVGAGGAWVTFRRLLDPGVEITLERALAPLANAWTCAPAARTEPWSR
ncbi:hypothetical protein CFHF_24255 [Caulobacter flavus]|uniref:Uncharacterized protein n=1 Tax=Caulobacter flavus TaxID=1679497 RepID=A0A2N5CLS9_9CAUL|nr:hypothetical protein CFHF_24255 [Caulobacter flavus]